ncbi:heme ABC exporter ATP-binding protein CcmA [Hyphomicrobium sp.]|uniref:heme ABC exporter ATP-binding protein CcmA n=1 Tax=Hyphomicrobium sp. TaxID=82 RepID=UPI003F6F86FF
MHAVQSLLLHADNLTVERGTRPVISALSFTAKAGEALLLVGPNGAGKTTLIRTIAGFIRPSSGHVALKGDSEDRDVAQSCHYVGHLTGVKANLTVTQNLAFWGAYLADGAGGRDGLADRVDDALEQFGLSRLADFPAGLLSAGQKRRLGLARLCVAARPIWLLDEPTVSLDTASTELLARLIQAHTAGGGIVIAATHLPLGLEQPRYLRLGASPEAPA